MASGAAYTPLNKYFYIQQFTINPIVEIAITRGTVGIKNTVNQNVLKIKAYLK